VELKARMLACRIRVFDWIAEAVGYNCIDMATSRNLLRQSDRTRLPDTNQMYR